MKSLKGSKTEKNLMLSFAGESQARMRYTYFASQAKKDGYVQIQNTFIETANQEKEHAERFFKFMEGGECEITSSFPAGKIGTTIENLTAAAAGEHEEWSELYPKFADIAQEEGFKEIATTYRMIAIAEKAHETRYKKYLERLTGDRMFIREKKIFWQCLNCGFIWEGTKPPEICPACAHPQSYFEPMRDNY